MTSFETEFEANTPDPKEGPWCLMIDGKVHGPFASYKRVKAIVAELDWDDSNLYFQLIWSQGWHFWDSIFSYYTEEPVPTTARPSHEPPIPVLRWGRIAGFKNVDTDANKLELASTNPLPCPRWRVLMHQMKAYKHTG